MRELPRLKSFLLMIDSMTRSNYIQSFFDIVDYPRIWSETFDICVGCMLKKVFPLIEKEFGIKTTHIRDDEK